MTTPSRGRTLVRTELLAVVGVVLGLSILVFVTGSWPGTYYSPVRVLSVVVAAGGSLVWLAIAFRDPGARPASLLMVGFAASLFAFAISAALAPHPRFALDFLGYALLLTVLYFMLVRIWATPVFSTRLHVLLVVGCGISGIWFIAATAGSWLMLWGAVGRFVVPPLRLTNEGLWLGTPNAIAAFQVLLFCTVLPGVLEHGRRGRALAAGLAVIVAASVLLSGSRGAWLGLGVATAVCGVAWLVMGGAASIRHQLRPWRRRHTVVAAMTVVGVGVLAAILGPTVLARAANLGGAELRGSLLTASARMFEAAPLTGQGPGSWAPYRLPFTSATEVDYYIPHAHNLPAQVAAEFGLAGLVAMIVVVVVIVRLVLRGLRSDDRFTQRLGLAVLFACVFQVGQQMVDAWIHQPAIILAIALPIALLDATLGRAPSQAPTDGEVHGSAQAGPYPPRRMLTVTMMVAVIVGSGAALAPEGAAMLEQRAVSAANDGDWVLARELASGAVASDPGLPPYHFTLGISASRTGALEEAREAFAAAAADDFPAAWLNLAAIQTELGDPAATAALDRAVRLGRQQPAIAVPAAELYRQLGEPGRAEELLAAAFVSVPSLASDPLWGRAEWQAIAAGAVERAMAEADPWTAVVLALETDQPDAARAAVPSLSPAEQPLAELLIAAWSGDQASFAELGLEAQRDPLDKWRAGLCRRVAALHDPSRLASGWTCPGGKWTASYPIVRISGPEEVDLVGGPDAYFHGTYSYRRALPRALLVPWLPHLQDVAW